MRIVYRMATEADQAAIVAIYNHYVVNTPITFDLDACTVESRRPWFAQFQTPGRYQLLVAEDAGSVIGYAASMPFRNKAAFDPSVETTVYLRPNATGAGLGARLYAALFDRLGREDVHRAYAGITLPNAASVALHKRFDFRLVGEFSEAGRKLGRYWDVAWYEKRFADPGAPH